MLSSGARETHHYLACDPFILGAGMPSILLVELIIYCLGGHKYNHSVVC
jgi:hypothetical protein